MIRSFKFEVRNFIKSKTYLFFLGVFTLMLIWPTLQQLDKVHGNADTYSARSTYFVKRDKAMKQLSDWKKEPPETTPVHPSVADLEAEVALLKPLVNAYVNEEDHFAIDKMRLEYEKLYLKELQNGRTDKEITALQQAKTVAEIDYTIAHNMNSIWVPDVKVPALNRVFTTLTKYTPLIWVMMILALAVGYYIIDDKRHATIDFINSSPTGKGVIMFNKQLVFFFGMVLVLTVSFGINFLVPTLTDGFGQLNYPVVYSLDGTKATIMTMATFFKWYGLYLIAVVVFLIGLSALIQLFTSNILVNLIALVSIVMLGQTSSVTSKLGAYLPTNYFNVLQVIIPDGGRGELLSLTGGFLLVLVSGLMLSGLSIGIAQVRRRI